MTKTTLTPYDLSDAQQVGKHVFRKQILKMGTINYKGQKIVFDKPFLMDLAKSFKKRAYDQVPFVLADPQNQHNMDPEKFRGELTSIELTNKGLDGIFTLTPQGAKVVKNNPRLGVSARIVQGVEHADGRTFGKAIQHVLATMNPRVTGMEPWQAINLSEDDEGTEVVDLTAATYKEGSQMATKTKAKGKPASRVVAVTTSKGESKIDLSALTDEEFQGLLDLAASVEDDDEDDTGVEDVTDELDDDEDDEDESDEDDDESDEDEEDDEEGDDDEDDEDDDTDLSNPIPPQFLKNIKRKKAKGTIAPPKVAKAKRKGKRGVVPPVADQTMAGKQVNLSIEERLAKSEWRRERRELARAGVPPYLLDLAEPVLSSPQAFTIDLSNDEKADAGEIVRNMLEATKGYIEVKPEIGHQIDLSADEPTVDPSKEFLAEWDKEYGKA